MKRFSYKRDDIKPLTKDVCEALREAVHQRGVSRIQAENARRYVITCKLDANLQACREIPQQPNRERMIAYRIACDPDVAAAHAYDEGALKYHGEFARLNFHQ